MSKTSPNSSDPEILRKEYNQLKEKNFKQKYWFWFGIAMGFCILVIAYLTINKIDCYQSIIKLAEFAATLLSIVLSVFAIMYTYTTNQQIGEKFKDIDNAARDICGTATLIRTEATRMNERIDNLQNQFNNFVSKLPNNNAGTGPYFNPDTKNAIKQPEQ